MLPDLRGIRGITIRGRFRTNEWSNIKLIPDLHLGAEATNKAHIIQDLEEAKELNARIFIGGDVFDGIMTKDFKRYEPEVIDKKIRGRNDLLNATLDLGTEFLKPYAHLIDGIGEGNHETAVRRHHNISLIPLLMERLQTPEHKIHFLGYKAIIQIIDLPVNQPTNSRTTRILFFHGSGGSAPVTRGAIDLYRIMSEVDGCDVVWVGHKHTRIAEPMLKYKQKDNGDIMPYECRGVITGAYLNSIEDSYGIEKGYRPEPHGGAIFKYKHHGRCWDKKTCQIEI